MSMFGSSKPLILREVPSIDVPSRSTIGSPGFDAGSRGRLNRPAATLENGADAPSSDYISRECYEQRTVSPQVYDYNYMI